MAREKSSKSPANVSAKASARIGASASYSVKKNITQHIPADVTRANSSAWLDLISPLTEWAGLRGDKLRLKRDQLRLEQEDTLLCIAEKTSKILESRNKHAKPVPSKFLIQFLERASLEKPEDEIVNLWTSLLASAADEYSSYHLHFVGILSQMSVAQAHVFTSIIGDADLKNVELAMDAIESYFSRSQVFHFLHEIITNDSDLSELVAKEGLDEFCSALGERFNGVGIDGVYGDAGLVRDRTLYSQITFSSSSFSDDRHIDYNILEALNLIALVDTGIMNFGTVDVSLKYYILTPLGLEFAKACGIIS